MAPYIYWRVEDADSSAQYVNDEGIIAGERYVTVDFTPPETVLLRHQLEQHLDWGNRDPTPFVSVYSNKDVAWREARRRVNTGKQDVRIYKVDTRESFEDMEYRNIRRLAKKLRVPIPEYAWHNSMYEYIFLACVPESAIVDYWEL